MNREILFKAKRKDNCEWVEGNLITNERNENQKYIGYIFDERNGVIEDFDIVEVIPETLCQYTGLTDKNGQKIWENDICDTFENNSKEMLRNVVKFEDGCFKVFKKHYLSMHLDCYEESDLKVVGNVFDHPNLLEVE